MSKNNKKGLGRTFDSLIPTTLDTQSLIQDGERIEKLGIDNIQASPDQPRTVFDKNALEELAQSIKEHGIIQPIVVTKTDDGKYTIVAGERRWRAAKLAGLSKIPSIVRSAKTLERLEIALIENVQRVDLSPLEQAVSVERLREQFNLSVNEIANKLGKAPATLSNIIRLLSLPDYAKKALAQGLMTEGHARAILSVKDYPESQKRLSDSIVKKHLSVRQAEQMAIAIKEKPQSIQKQKRLQNETNETKLLQKKLKSKVTLKWVAKGGYIQIRFRDENDLKRIATTISE